MSDTTEYNDNDHVGDCQELVALYRLPTTDNCAAER